MFDLKPQPIHRDRLYEQVARQIQQLIVSTEWPGGSKIPAERELGERQTAALAAAQGAHLFVGVVAAEEETAQQ